MLYPPIACHHPTLLQNALDNVIEEVDNTSPDEIQVRFSSSLGFLHTCRFGSQIIYLNFYFPNSLSEPPSLVNLKLRAFR
jgi:hypothetical protein